MALTLDATVGGASSNSYILQADASSYFDGQFNTSEWTSASTGDKDKALVMATSRLEDERYIGRMVTSTQRLQWPRWGVPDLTGYGYYSSTAIPRFVQEATCQLALAILKDNTLFADTGLEGFDNVTVGPLSIAVRNGRKAGTLPQEVIRLLQDLRIPQSSQPSIIRG